MERSETPRCDALLSLKLPKSLKREAQKKAEAEGVTLSEVVRRQLQELGSEKATA
jgi:antitoxin component of RelBE/YafQ-DinJ toxin-antitoxin module